MPTEYLYIVLIVFMFITAGLGSWVHIVKEEIRGTEKRKQKLEDDFTTILERHVRAKCCILLLLQQSKHNTRDPFEMSKGTYSLAYRMAGGINETPDDWKTLECLLDIEKGFANKEREDAKKGKADV